MGVDHGDAVAPSLPVQRKYRYSRTFVDGIFLSFTALSRNIMIGLVFMLILKRSLGFLRYWIRTTCFTYDTYQTHVRYNQSSNSTRSNTTVCCFFLLLLAAVVRLLARARLASWCSCLINISSVRNWWGRFLYVGYLPFFSVLCFQVN